MYGEDASGAQLALTDVCTKSCSCSTRNANLKLIQLIDRRRDRFTVVWLTVVVASHKAYTQSRRHAPTCNHTCHAPMHTHTHLLRTRIYSLTEQAGMTRFPPFWTKLL